MATTQSNSPRLRCGLTWIPSRRRPADRPGRKMKVLISPTAKGGGYCHGCAARQTWPSKQQAQWTLRKDSAATTQAAARAVMRKATRTCPVQCIRPESGLQARRQCQGLQEALGLPRHNPLRVSRQGRLQRGRLRFHRLHSLQGTLQNLQGTLACQGRHPPTGESREAP